MGEITLSFVFDPENNKRELWVDYKSEDDWLPAEHEQRHRQIVRRLIAEGKLDPDKIDRIQVTVEGKVVATEAGDDFEELRDKNAQAEKE